MGYKWQPLQRANIVSDEPPELIAAAMRLWNLSEVDARKRLDEEHQRLRTEYWVNDLYQVAVSYHSDGIVQLNIRRHRKTTFAFRLRKTAGTRMTVVAGSRRASRPIGVRPSMPERAAPGLQEGDRTANGPDPQWLRPVIFRRR